MKQETIEQLLLVAGKQEYTQTMVLSVSQVQAMLESAYEAGQRDPNTVDEDYELHVRPVVSSPEVALALVQET